MPDPEVGYKTLVSVRRSEVPVAELTAGEPSFALVDGSIWGAWGRRPVPLGAGG